MWPCLSLTSPCFEGVNLQLLTISSFDHLHSFTLHILRTPFIVRRFAKFQRFHSWTTFCHPSLFGEFSQCQLRAAFGDSKRVPGDPQASRQVTWTGARHKEHLFYPAPSTSPNQPCPGRKAGCACTYRAMHIYESKYRHSVNFHMKWSQISFRDI